MVKKAPEGVSNSANVSIHTKFLLCITSVYEMELLLYPSSTLVVFLNYILYMGYNTWKKVSNLKRK